MPLTILSSGATRDLGLPWTISLQLVLIVQAVSFREWTDMHATYAVENPVPK